MLESTIMKLPNFRHFVALRGKSFGINTQDLGHFGDEFLNGAFENPALSENISHLANHTLCKNPAPIANPTLMQPLKFLFILEASILSKMYPIAQYCALAELLNTHYPNIAIYIIWNSDENRANALRDMLQSRLIRTIKLPRLDFNRIKFVLKNIDMVIGGDTGITHLAWAMGVRNIVLLGNAPHTSGKNMRQTRLKRVLLGNPFVISDSGEFEIASITPQRIFERVKAEISAESW